MQGSTQLAPDLVITYANYFNTDLTQVGWYLQKHEEVLNDIAWVRLHNALKNQVGPIKPARTRFPILNVFFTHNAASEFTHVESKNPSEQHHQQQQQQQQPTDLSFIGGEQ